MYASFCQALVQESSFSPANKAALEITAMFVHALCTADSSSPAMKKDANLIEKMLHAESHPCDEVELAAATMEKLKGSSDPIFVLQNNIVLLCVN